MSEINLSKAVRSNLLSLQNTANLMSKTQNRLATGLKVNSALDNPTNFFTASSLNSRAGDINQLLDSMANGIQTLEAADNGLSAITKTLESMQSTLRQARQDKSFQTASFEVDSSLTSGKISFAAGSIGDTAVEVSLVSDVNTAAAATTASTATDLEMTTTLDTLGITNGQTIIIGNGTDTYTFTATDAETATIDDLINGLNADTDVNVNADLVDGQLVLTADDNETEITVSGTGAIAGLAAQGAPTAAYATRTTNELVDAINGNPALAGKIRASNDNGSLRIENLSTQSLSVGGVGSTGKIDGTSSIAKDTVGGNEVRADLAKQFRELRDQLDKLADDASFNGINLLRGDNLKITFNETGTSDLDIQSKEEQGINSGVLNINPDLQAQDLDSDDNIDDLLDDVKTAINAVRSQASAFGSSLSIVQNRQDFSKNMINTLQTGAANLTLADTNEEAANLLALQTRQQLSSTALSMASQADQAVLRLF